MKILNPDGRDYHIHSSSFSDGLNSIDEIVKFAGTIGLKEIAITDHSQTLMERLTRRCRFYPSCARYSLPKWGNVWNDVNVIFGVEGDLLNEDGDVCFDIQGIEPDFIILSAHSFIYEGKPENVTSATIKAIERYHDKIKFIGHPCNTNDFGMHYDVVELVEFANKYDIPIEFNAGNLSLGKTNLEKLDYILKNSKYIYINSDAHTLYGLREYRTKGLEFLSQNYSGYIKEHSFMR